MNVHKKKKKIHKIKITKIMFHIGPSLIRNGFYSRGTH